MPPPAVPQSLAPSLAALQQRPRPLPLFLQIAVSQTQDDPARLARVLAGLEVYQTADRALPPPPPPVIARAGNARLLDYGGAGRPVLFIPSLINPPSVLDLSVDRSLVRWLSGRGVRPLLVDWGTPEPQDHILDIDGHITQRLLPLIDTLGGEAPAMVGYCLGGTMAIAAATLRPPPRLALLATPWHFERFPAEARESLDHLWESGRHASEALGVLPMEMLQTLFWMLDPGRTISKFEHLASLDRASQQSQSFIALEDWANDGAPLTYAAARQLFDDLVAADVTGRGQWQINGHLIDPNAIDAPLLNIISATDRIVPAASSIDGGQRIVLQSGHVGMVVGSRAKEQLWEPLARFLTD